MLNIIYLSKNISSSIQRDYVSASYQQNVIDELSLKSNLFHYGPGYKYFDIDDQLENIIQKSSFSPDLLIFGHNWLKDAPNEIFNSLMPNLNVKDTRLTKIGILNKEYSNLRNKLSYYKKNKFNLIFSHHHENDIYEAEMGINCVFWPFACNYKKFEKKDNTKETDIFFSGVLKNTTKYANQSDFRINCLNKIFINFFDEPIKRKKKFEKYNVIWNSVPRNTIGRILKSALGRRLFDYEDYPNFIKNSKIVINSLSPKGLVSPRYFETMLSKSAVFCESSILYKNIFDKNYFFEIDSDAENFEEKVFYYLDNFSKYESVLNEASDYVKNNHTWEIRISQMLKAINNI